MVCACGGDVDDLALHCLDKRRIFPFWVYDNHIGVRVCEDDVRHFLLCRKGFSCPRHTEDKGISVQKVAAVGDNHIFADDILPVIHAVFVVDFLHTERDKHRKALRGKGTQGVNPADAKGQGCVQPVHLLIFQHGELAEVLPCHGQQGFRIIVKLFLCFRRMHHRQHRKQSFSGHGLSNRPEIPCFLSSAVQGHRG